MNYFNKLSVLSMKITGTDFTGRKYLKKHYDDEGGGGIISHGILEDEDTLRGCGDM
jgi:hypothetical protein